MRYLVIIFLLLIACQSRKKEVVINWQDQRAVSISIPDDATIYLKDYQNPVLGDLTDHTFTPLVPFQRGETYLAISSNDTLVFTIPADSTAVPPNVLASHPSCDTVPSNLLKVFLQFSEPMQEYRSSQFVFLYDDITGDTINNAFLDLKPELWNDERTGLTLWIDPGRIKQDLVPNKDLGTVLKDHHRYRLEVNTGWRSQKGVESTRLYSKKFVTSGRDVTKPDVDRWIVKANRDTIVVRTRESLDWLLLQHAITINGYTTKTIVEVCEQQLKIIPNAPLSKGKHTLIVDAKLEDLAGNNLNRLFETDLNGKDSKSVARDSYVIPFSVN